MLLEVLLIMRPSQLSGRARERLLQSCASCEKHFVPNTALLFTALARVAGEGKGSEDGSGEGKGSEDGSRERSESNDSDDTGSAGRFHASATKLNT